MEGPTVEFVDGPNDAPAASVPRWTGRSDLVAAGLWLAAAVLCAVSSTRTVFTYRIDIVGVHTRGGYDALGHALDPELAQDYGPRYAIVLGVVVVGFLGLAGVLVGELRGHATGRLRRLVVPAAIAVLALLTGVLACIGLSLDSSFASYRSVVGPMSDDQANAVRLTIGGCLWFGLGALVCGGLALAILLWRRGGTSVWRRGHSAAPTPTAG